MHKNYLNKYEKDQIWKLAAFENTLEDIINNIEESGASGKKDLLKWLRSAKTFNKKAMEEYMKNISEEEVGQFFKQYSDKQFYVR